MTPLERKTPSVADTTDPHALPIDEYRDLFPVARRRTWLNHASQGTLAQPVLHALHEALRQHAEGDFDGPREFAMYERVRSVAADFIGAAAGEVSFTKNIPDALNIIAHGLQWRPGDTILIPDQEFPANVYPWRNLAEQGVETLMVPSRDGDVAVDDIIDRLDQRTRLVSVSWVQFATGFRVDLRRLADACHDNGTLLCVDAIQGLGAFPLDVAATGIDFLATSSHKWLLAPTGAGWLYCRKELVPSLNVQFVGQSSYERRVGANYLDYDLPLWPDSRRFEPGIHNQLGLVGLEASLKLLTEIGAEPIRDQIRTLSSRVADELTARGYHVVSNRHADHWSGIVAFESDRTDMSAVHKALTAADVITSLRGPRVRVSTHFYNDHDDIDRLLAALPD
jgi:cysteine desulfurase / selenocysteine lyase